ncbi:uncharacterized protein LOC130990487 [Salvia miltiorrhiza]|uniref:uncharacterized protein LOC130990487 n=1 Tax=Salvia miltiorrhiza TaxID=226208 RepID=UPI0025AC6866|nr:uncharacterized protein LOC130990487 [Salvia miltiorrhiza]
MAQEELSVDSWAWRKYGHKPIKGSPYPRCSTRSKLASPLPKGLDVEYGFFFFFVARRRSEFISGYSVDGRRTQNEDVQMAEEDDGAVDEDDENIIMIPSDLMIDDDDIHLEFSRLRKCFGFSSLCKCFGFSYLHRHFGYL